MVAIVIGLIAYAMLTDNSGSPNQLLAGLPDPLNHP
jgi:hypothetical protein